MEMLNRVEWNIPSAVDNIPSYYNNTTAAIFGKICPRITAVIKTNNTHIYIYGIGATLPFYMQITPYVNLWDVAVVAEAKAPTSVLCYILHAILGLKKSKSQFFFYIQHIHNIRRLMYLLFYCCDCIPTQLVSTKSKK